RITSFEVGASERPAPTAEVDWPIFSAVPVNFFHRAVPRSPEDCAHSAATPATCGVAMLVPLLNPYRVGIGTLEYTETPGAAMFTSPPLGLIPRHENEA